MLDLVNTFDNLRPLMGLYPMNGQQQAAYVEAIRLTCGWMKLERFTKVCLELLNQAKPDERPVPSSFVAVYHKLKEREGWTDPVPEKCVRCGGECWTKSWLWNNIQQIGYSALKPCPLCNPAIHSLAENFREITEEEFETYMKKERTTSAAAIKNQPPPATVSDEQRHKNEISKKKLLADFRAAVPMPREVKP